MSNSATAVANSFIARAKKEELRITHLKLQKLTYLVQGWHLAMFDKPAFEDKVYAWQYGPIIRNVYMEFNHNGFLPIVNECRKYDNTVDYIEGKDMKTVFDFVWKIYADKDAFHLSALTHAQGTPWDQTRKKREQIITQDLIKQHFKEIIEKGE